MEPGGAETGVTVRLHYPDVRIQSYVTFYYFVEAHGRLRDFLYPEWANVRFALEGDWGASLGNRYPAGPLHTPLFGPTDRAAEIVTQGGRIAGFGLTPLGWNRLFAMPAAKLANRLMPMGDLLGTPGEDIRRALIGHGSDAEGAALFDALLIDRLATRPPNDDVAIAIDAALRDRPIDVAAFAEAAGLSDQRLRRACQRVFGFGPKRLLRRQRFLDTLGHIRVTEKPEFSALIDPEYFDQSHFNHEFREFMGLTPRAYLSVPRPLMGTAAQAQTAVGIPLSFRLPPPPEEAQLRM